MDFQKALGQVLRELRVVAGLTREACAEVVNRDHLAKIEQGRESITLVKLHALCQLLQVPPSTVLFTAEARLGEQKLEQYKTQWNTQVDQLMLAGHLQSEIQVAASAGVRGKRAEETRSAVRKLQAEGYAKMEIVRSLGIGRSTVDRYWLK